MRVSTMGLEVAAVTIGEGRTVKGIEEMVAPLLYGNVVNGWESL